MNIETKFNIGNEVYFVHKDEILYEEITSIDITIVGNYTSIDYCFKINSKLIIKDGNKLFKTLDELFDHYKKAFECRPEW